MKTPEWQRASDLVDKNECLRTLWADVLCYIDELIYDGYISGSPRKDVNENWTVCIWVYRNNEALEKRYGPKRSKQV